MSAGLPEDPLIQLARLALALQSATERCARRGELSPTLARLLGLLRDRTPTMNELAAALGLDKSSTSGLIDRAERRGLVRRLPSQLDRRSVRVRLTPEGRALDQSVSSHLNEELGAMLEPLNDERRRALAALLSAILSPR